MLKWHHQSYYISVMSYYPNHATFRTITKPLSMLYKLKPQHCAIFCTPFSTLVTPPLSEMIHLSLLFLSLSSVLPDGKIWSLPFLGLRQGGGRGGAIQGSEGIKFCHLATLKRERKRRERWIISLRGGVTRVEKGVQKIAQCWGLSWEIMLEGLVTVRKVVWL